MQHKHDTNTPLSSLPSIGPYLLKKLQNLGLQTIRDLFYYFPRRYENFAQYAPIQEIKFNQLNSVTGTIIDLNSRRSFGKKLFITKALIQDSTGSIEAIWFNKPYLEKYLKKGTRLSLSGKTAINGKKLVLSNPSYEIIGSEPVNLIHTGTLVPIYSETSGLTSRWIRKTIHLFLPLAKKMPDFLPIETRQRRNLIALKEALKQIHFPKDLADAENAKKRFAFEEILLLQLNNELSAAKRNEQTAPQLYFNQTLIKGFVDSLPFKLTDSQKISAWEILKDLEKPSPMNRLLEGDVGSGKTIVAALATLQVLHHKHQSVLMAPTEVLARQHFETISKFFNKTKFSIALLTGSEHQIIGKKTRQILKPSRQSLIQKVRNNEIDFIIGTHALIQKKIQFNNLGLAIIDEQHRFGVRQRAEIRIKNISGLEPHLLTMTATPIPRTLALALYSDLSLSIIKEMPAGRQKIITAIVPPEKRQETYQFIKQELNKGRQVFVICPLIDDSEKMEAKSVKQEYEKLSKNIFPEFKLSIIHGKLKAKEKQKVMAEFKKRKIDILISTSVVEVGIDIPNATVILIEGAERFGLAQLHQFRGRVGRGEHRSYCFLFSESSAKNTRQRLKALIKAENSFDLAEEDLKIRGPGQFFGIKQSGQPDIAMASLNNIELIKEARDEAILLLQADKSLARWPLLRQRIKQIKEIHKE